MTVVMHQMSIYVMNILTLFCLVTPVTYGHGGGHYTTMAHQDSMLSTPSPYLDSTKAVVKGEDMIRTGYYKNGTAWRTVRQFQEGSPPAHFMTGISLVVLGLWWMINIYSFWYRSRMADRPYKSQISYACFCTSNRLKNIPWEGCVKISFTVVLIIMELAILLPVTTSVTLRSSLHIAIITTIGVSGLIDILVYYKIDLPPSMDYIGTSLLFAVEALGFANHPKKPDKEVDAVIHQFITYCAALTAVTILLEIKYPHSFLLSLARAYFAILQGTWFMIAGYNLMIGIDEYKSDSNKAHFIVVYFIWNVVVDMLLTLIVGGVVKVVFVRINGPIQTSGFDADGSKLPLLNKQ